MVIKWIVAKLTGGKLVYLQDMDGEVTTSIAYKNPFGGLICQRYWPFKIRHCVLGANGVVAQPHYVKKWMFV